MRDEFSKSDPFTLQIFRNALVSIADHMAITIARSARSIVVKEALDFSSALFDKNCEMIAQGTCIPAHLGSMPEAVLAAARTFAGNFHDGDVVALNDPFQGSTHLPDIILVRPCFLNAELLGYAAVLAHHIDVGGRVPGSSASDSTEIYQEGLRIPPVKLVARGQTEEAWLRLISANVRAPDKVLGDLRAQLAACQVGEVGLVDLARRLGVNHFRSLSLELLEYTEEYTKSQIADVIPDGTYRATDFIDDDGRSDAEIQICVAIQVSGGSIEVDFTGSSGQAATAINSVGNFTRSVTWACIRSVLDSKVPNNSGFFRPIKITLPEQSIVNAQMPAAVAARALTGFRIADTLFRALADALPDRVPATGSAEPEIGVTIAGDDLNGVAFVYFESLFGSWGARSNIDGTDGCSGVVVNYSNTPIEIIEADYPLQIEAYGFVADTGGVGQSRGGLSIERRIRFLGRKGLLQLRSDRRRHPPRGLQGGGQGSPSGAWLTTSDGVERSLPSKCLIHLAHGDLVRILVPGAGGFGLPRMRAHSLIERDIREGKMSADHAATFYDYHQTATAYG